LEERVARGSSKKNDVARVTLHTGSIKKQKRTKLPLPLDGLRKGKETNPIEVNRKKEKTAARRRRGGII